MSKTIARSRLHTAVENGTIIPSKICADCDGNGVGKGGIIAHHPNYNKPLDVIWVCMSCHAKRHGNGKFRRPKTTRNNKIMNYVNKGYTLKRIASMFHISTSRVSQIVSTQQIPLSNEDIALKNDSSVSSKAT